jgi:hypothetical protein
MPPRFRFLSGASGQCAQRALLGYRLPLRDRKFADSPLEGDGFELLVRERGEAGLSRPFDAPVCLGRVGSRWSDPATRSALGERIPIAVSELADQYLMRSVTWASSSLTAKAASLNRGRLITARIPFDNA